MKIAVAGATGFLGSAVTRALRARGDTVLPLVRPGGKARPSADAIGWDPYAGTIDTAKLEGIDVVVNLAGASIGGGLGRRRHVNRIRESRVRTTDLLARTIADLRSPPSVFIAQSATGFYGDHGEEQVVETSAAGRDPLAQIVADWEASAEPARAAGIRVVTTRTALVYHPSGGMLRPILIAFRFGAVARIGSGRQWQPWVTLGDAVAAILWLIDGDVAGPVNISAPDPVRNERFTAIMARILRRPVLLSVPAPIIKVGAGQVLASALLASQRVVPARLEAAGFTFADRDLEQSIRVMLAR